MSEEERELYPEVVIPNVEGGDAFTFVDIVHLGECLSEEKSILEELIKGNSEDERWAKPLQESCNALQSVVAVNVRNKDAALDGKLLKDLSNYFTAASKRIPRLNTPERRLVQEAFNLGGYQTAAGVVAYLNRPSDSTQFSTLNEKRLGAFFAAIMMEDRFANISKNVWTEFISSCRSELDAFRNYMASERDGYEKQRQRYEDIKSFEAPAKYWKDKADDCRNYAQCLVAVIGLLGALLSWLIVTMASNIPERPTITATEPVGEANDDASTNYAYLPYVRTVLPIIVVSFGTVWLIRVGLRFAFNLWHVSTDAAERAILIQTWQAMNESKDPPKSEEREIMMRQIFRHVPTGASDTDTVPPTVITAIQG